MNIAVFCFFFNIDRYVLHCNLQFWKTLVPPQIASLIAAFI